MQRRREMGRLLPQHTLTQARSSSPWPTADVTADAHPRVTVRLAAEGAAAPLLCYSSPVGEPAPSFRGLLTM